MLPSVLLTGEATGVLDETMIAAITNGFNTLSASVGQVMAVALPATIGMIALVGGINFAIKMVKGALRKAN